MPDRLPTNVKVLARLFANRGISTDRIAFYNEPAFLAAEKRDPSFLEIYAAWVRARPRDKAYDGRVRSVVPRMAQILEHEIRTDSQLGVCIDASMMLTKMLEEQGIWCYAAKGALTVSAPSLVRPTHFWMIDDEPTAGHVWVVAPPFEIIDITLKKQAYAFGEAAILPDSVVLETAPQIRPTADDFCSASVLEHAFRRRGPLPEDIHFRLSPQLERAATSLPSFEVTIGETALRYAVGGVTLSDGPCLHAITSRRWNGRLAGELYDQIVRPGL